jgi:butyrate kinase
MNYIVAHLGGGISITAHQNGRMIDVVSDDEGPFSPERAGRVPCKNLVKMCYSDKYTKEAILKRFRGTGGLAGYLNTNSALDVEAMIAEGDEKAKLLYDAMAYQISKGIGELATVLCGKVDRIIVTGGIAYSKMVTENIKKRVSFIAPVEVVPGENELESLALGALRVIKGEEKASTFEE